jgi:hypothetical protein
VRSLPIETLEEGWCDKDVLMLHAAFQILVDFVEVEHPEMPSTWDFTEEQTHAWKEIQDLYKWWKEERGSRDMNESLERELEWQMEDQQNFHRLVDVRLHLWT